MMSKNANHHSRPLLPQLICLPKSEIMPFSQQPIEISVWNFNTFRRSYLWHLTAKRHLIIFKYNEVRYFSVTRYEFSRAETQQHWNNRVNDLSDIWQVTMSARNVQMSIASFCTSLWLTAGWLVFNDILCTNRHYRAMSVWNIHCLVPGGRGTHSNISKQNEKNAQEHSLQPGLSGDNLHTADKRPQWSPSSKSLGNYWQLNQNN